MRVVLDTNNILVSALIAPAGIPAAIYNAWEDGKFTLLPCAELLDELRATLHKPRVAELIKPIRPGAWSTRSEDSPGTLARCRAWNALPIPRTIFCLPWKEAAGKADCLVKGDKSGLHALGRHQNTRIISARKFVALLA